MHLPHLTENKENVSDSLEQKIELIVQRLPPREVNITEIIEVVGKDSLMVLTIFLSLVFLVPVSIPGVSTVFGTGILLIGIAGLFNWRLRLPKAIAYRKLSSEQLRAGFKVALVWVRRLEKISRPHRLPLLTSAGWISRVHFVSFVLAALLLMAPFGLIPFSNTLPALALIFLAVGMLRRDGYSILLSYLANGVTLVYFTILIAAGGWSIHELFRFLN